MDSGQRAAADASPSTSSPTKLSDAPSDDDRLGRRPAARLLVAVVLTGAGILATTGAYALAVYLVDRFSQHTYTNQFTIWVFLVHVLTGVALLLPFLFLALAFIGRARGRADRRGVGSSVALLVAGIVAALAGVLLVQFDGWPQLPTGSFGRNLAYGLHLAAPLAAAAAYLLYRRSGPPVRWRWGFAWAVATGLFLLVVAGVHSRHPQQWNIAGAAAGADRFEPASTRTVDGKPIASSEFMIDESCRQCHADTYQDWFHSVHHFSSFNNPVYRFSVRETREVALKRDGNVRASRWCAGCHDPVPFLDGTFDNPDYDDVHDPTAQAGVGCAVCHSITHVNSTIGNGDYTIEAPQQYPFAGSSNAILRWVNYQLVKAQPDFHKKSMLKPLHRTSEFCSTCHKVSLPMELNHYKDFLRGQNHYDPHLLSGASGHGVRGFYYPPVAKAQCNDCHMPLKPSDDFASRVFDGSGTRKIHNHLTPGANTGVPWLASLERPQDADGLRAAVQTHTDFLRGTDPAGKDRALRIDIFGLKRGGAIDGELIAPLRPEVPALVPGETYLVEVVIRTLNVGHLFTQGTIDSNEVWVEFSAASGNRTIGGSGGLDGPNDSGQVDRWAHFVNGLVLDRNGNRINRHNPQDIYAAVYDHQIPPGAAQVVHYALQVPKDLTGPIELRVRLRYRKIDHEYTSYVMIQDHPEFRSLLRQAESIPQLLNRQPLAVARLLETGLDAVPRLPIVDLCEDRLVLPVAGLDNPASKQVSPIEPTWQRWNDYGIGCFLEGGGGLKRGELRQAEAAFRQLLTLDQSDAHAHAYTNLARVYLDEARLDEAADVLNRARTTDPPAAWWTVAWLTGAVNAQTGHLDEAIANFEQILDPRNQPRERKFDFTKDYSIIDELASVLFKRSQQETDRATREGLLRQAVERYESTLQLDREDLDAHYGLSQCFARLGDAAALPPAETGPVDHQGLGALARRFADAGLSNEQRLEAAAQLWRGIPQYEQRPAEPNRPKLHVWLDLVAACRPAFGSASDPLPEPKPGDAQLRRAAASLLGLLYRHTHEGFRPDENARDRTVRLYRQQHPAADHAAQAIVLYSLHPGSDSVLPGSKVKVVATEPQP